MNLPHDHHPKAPTRALPTFCSLLLTFFLSLSSCTDQTPPARKMAEGLCECMKPLSVGMKNLDAGVGINPDTQPNELIAQIDSIMNLQVSPCLDALESRYLDQLRDQEQAIRRQMASLCPDVVQAMNQASSSN